MPVGRERREEGDTAVVAGTAGTVLVVDDDPTLLQMTADMLERGGYAALTAGSGARALDLVDRRLAGLVTDVQMPGISGIELVRRVRESHPDLPIVVVTGHPGSDTIREAERAGAAAVLAKPFTQATLLLSLEG